MKELKIPIDNPIKPNIESKANNIKKLINSEVLF